VDCCVSWGRPATGDDRLRLFVPGSGARGVPMPGASHANDGHLEKSAAGGGAVWREIAGRLEATGRLVGKDDVARRKR